MPNENIHFKKGGKINAAIIDITTEVLVALTKLFRTQIYEAEIKYPASVSLSPFSQT